MRARGDVGRGKKESDGWEAVDVVEVAVAIFAIAMLEMSCHEHRMGSLSLR
jgi:hypothetical protein